MSAGNTISLGQISPFSSLPSDELEGVEASLTSCEFPAGEVILTEDEQGGRYYVILEGAVEIIKARGTPDERLLGVREQGAFLGEMSLFVPDGRHTASVIARTPVRALQMDHGHLDALLQRYPDFAYEIIRTLSHRLDESENKTIRELRRKNRALEMALLELRAAQSELVEKERLERELEVAREIQHSILPSELPTIDAARFGAKIESMTAVGGDFYDVIPLDGDRVAIVVGDVSDHGVPAALLMAQTATLIRVLSPRHASPVEALREINRYLLRSNEAGMFVTLLFAVYDSKHGELAFARAGHELPVVFGRGGTEIISGEGVGQPLGLFEDVLIDEQRVTIETGGLAILYTDGVTDSLSPDGKLFGGGRLREIIDHDQTISPQLVCDRIFHSLREFRQGSPPMDDVTVVTVRFEGGDVN